MSQPLHLYDVNTHASLRHPLLLATPDTVPPVDELEMVHVEMMEEAGRVDDVSMLYRTSFWQQISVWKERVIYPLLGM